MKFKLNLLNLLSLYKKCMCLVFLLATTSLYAQQTRTNASFEISGVVKDVNDGPIIGASIIEKGASNGAMTDQDGKFSLKVKPNSVLVVTYIGYESQAISVGNKSFLNIVLKEDTKMIDEVVVVGYGVQKKATLTGAVSSVTNSEIVTTKNENVQNMLTGKIAGLRVVQNTSEPGSYNTSLDIRGLGNPLVIIDGVPRDNMARLDPQDIESVSVLKDASASIYGVRAANGVILITTKKGNNKKSEVSYSSVFSRQIPSGFPDMVDALGYMTLTNELSMHNVNGGNLSYNDDQIKPYLDGTKKSVDWRSAVIRDYAPQSQHTVSATGGNDKVSYYTSFGYQNQGSFFKTNDINYEKYNFRSNVSGKITDRLTVDVNVSGFMDKKSRPSTNAADIIRALWIMRPNDPIYVDDKVGYYNETAVIGNNPVAMMDADLTGYKYNLSKWFQSSATATYKIPWVKGLNAKAMYSYDFTMNDNKEFTQKYTQYKGSDGNYQTFIKQSPSTIKRFYYGKNLSLWQASLDYKNSFGGHNVSGLILYEEQKRDGDNFWGQKELTIPIDQLMAGNANNQQTGQGTGSSELYDLANQAIIGRVNYDYKSKYLLEFAFRYESSSKFSDDFRWALFPSVSAGWRVSEENFWTNSNLNFINNFKLRASYGKMGDDGSLAYQYLTGYTYPASGNSTTLPGGHIFDGNFVNSSLSKGLANGEITWIVANTFNAGADLEAWNGLLGATVEYFQRERTGLLATRSASLPGIVGASLPQENLNGDLSRGFEIELSHRKTLNKDFSYEVKGNMSFTRTKNIHIERAPSTNSFTNWRQNSDGRYNNIWWGYGTDGRFDNWNDIYYSPTFIGRGTILGDYAYEDWNKDGMISDLDVKPITYSGDRPLLNFGLTMAASYKGVDVSLLVQGAAKRHISYVELLWQPLWAATGALSQFMDRWHPVDPKADPYDPATKWESGRFAYTGSLPDQNSMFNMQNAAYLRLKNIEMGYTLPKSILEKTGIKYLRVYANCYNLLTLTKLKYVDPEHPSSTYGYEYPLNKTVSVGLNVKF